MSASDRIYSYSLIILDNYHLADPDEAAEYEVGPFPSCEAALNHARGVIDGFAVEHARGKNADELYSGWAQYGETPVLATDDSDCAFSGSEYARQRFEEICGAGDSGS